MKDRYKVLAEKYSLVNEDDKEDIMTGLDQMEKTLTPVYVGYTDPDSIGLSWEVTTIEEFLQALQDHEGDIEGHDAGRITAEKVHQLLTAEDVVEATGHGDYGMILYALSFNKQALENYALRSIELHRLRAL